MSKKGSSKSTVFQMFDKIRGSLSTSDFKGAFAALVFLRWAAFEEAEREAIAAFENVNHQPKSTSRFSWHDIQRGSFELEQMVRQLPDIVGAFANSQNRMIAIAAQHAALGIERFSRLSARQVVPMIEWLAHEPFETAGDRRGIRDILDEVLSRDAHKQTGDLFTPPSIAALMVEMAKPQPGETVYDPCFGSAGLLTTALDKISQRKDVNLKHANELQIRLAGVEINSQAFVVGATRLGLSGFSNARLEHGNSLREPEICYLSGGFDVALANPPWGMRLDMYGIEGCFPVFTKDSSSLFLQHSISQLSPGGRCVIVVPPSLLYRQGPERELREWLLEEHSVEAIVAMPKGAFSPYTSIETCILLIQEGGSTKSIRMVSPNLDKHGIASRTKNSPQEYSKIVEAIRSSKTDNVHSWDIAISEIAENDYDLTPKRRNRSDLESILKSIPNDLGIRLLSDCCGIRSGKSIRSNDLLDERPKLERLPTQTTNRDDLLPFKEVESRMQELELAIKDVNDNPLEDTELNKLRGTEMQEEFIQLQFQLLQHEAEFTKDRPPVPYVRIRDIDNNSVSRGSAWVNPLVAVTIQRGTYLKAGDILLSKSGTIGKAGIVRDGAVGGVAAGGISVLRVNDESIDPDYLLAFLQSTEVKQWMEDRSRGSGAKHLSLRAIKDLPVACPSLQIQRRTAAQNKEFDVDALTYLAELLSEDPANTLVAKLNGWVAASLRKLEETEFDSKSNEFLRVVESIAQSECPIQWCDECGLLYHEVCLTCHPDKELESVDSLAQQTPLATWATRFQMVIEGLRNVSTIPDDAFVYGLLNSARVGLANSLEQIEGYLPNEEKARELTESLIRGIGSFNSGLRTRSKIVVDLGDSVVSNGKVTFEAKVSNQGSLPLSDLVFRAGSEIEIKGKNRFPFLPPNEFLELILVSSYLDAPDSSPNTLDFQLEWSASTIAGNTIREGRELSVDFGPDNAEAIEAPAKAKEPLKHSPYITGSPVKSDRADVFVGREQLLDDIRQQIAHSGNVVLLEGNRRAGKSSILWHLEGCESVPGWIGVYFSFQGTEGDGSGSAKGIPSAEVFRGIATETAKSIRRNVGEVLLPNGDMLSRGKPGVVDKIRDAISDDAPFTRFREYIELLLDWLEARNLRLVWLLDEFDKLQDGIDSGITSPQVPENLRFLLQSDSRLTAILTSMKRFRRIREEYFSALYGDRYSIRCHVFVRRGCKIPSCFAGEGTAIIRPLRCYTFGSTGW